MIGLFRIRLKLGSDKLSDNDSKGTDPKYKSQRGGWLTFLLKKELNCPMSLYWQVTKVKVGVLRPVQQPGSYWDRSSELPLVGLEPTEVTAYD